MTKDLDRKIFWASVLVLLSVLVTLLSIMRGCDRSPSTVVIDEGVDPPATCGESEDGTARERTCGDGKEGVIIDLCRDGAWKEVSNTCRDISDPGDNCEGETLFADVKPLLTEKCLGCHFTPEKYDDYGVAANRIDAFLNRIGLPVDNPERMPLDPKPPLEPAEKDLLKKWKADGLKDKCDGGGSGGPEDFYFLDTLETRILEDLSTLDEDDRENSRYLVTSHKVNLGNDEGNLTLFREAIDKNLNMLNVVNEDVFKTQQIEPTIFRLDLRAYGLNGNDWKLIEDEDPFDLESFTDKGETIKFLAGARKPWLHFDTFTEVVGEAKVYYAITDVPNKLGDFLDQVGVDVNAQFDDFSAFFVGGNGSPISLLKNRLIVRFTGNDDFPWTWITFDPVDLDNVPERNLFEFPLLAGAGGTETRIFEFAASETITLSPGGMIFALWDANGIRQDFAPGDIVADVESPQDPIIEVPKDCTRCHKAGIIPMTDQIRDHVQANASEFDAADVEVILELYKSAGNNTAIFQSDNAEYADIAEKLDFGLTEDSITFTSDRYKLDWDIKEVASFLLLPEDEFRVLLGRSSVGRSQIGQLLTQGTISFDQFALVIDDLKDDLRLFQQPL